MKISLNFDWQLRVDDNKKIKSVNIPDPGVVISVNHFQKSDFEKTFEYEKGFSLEKEDLDFDLEILFEGVLHFARVYLNGILVTENKGGYLPFKVKINDFAVVGLNKLKVLVSGKEDHLIPPFGGVVDYLGYAGIYREVYLIKKPIKYIDDITIRYQDILNTNEVSFIINTSHSDGKIRLEIFNKDNIVISDNTVNINSKETIIKQNIKEKHLWDIDDPYLYKVKVTYNDLDIMYESFGLREAIFKPNGFYLNGKLLKLMGLNRHQSYPYNGNAMPKGAQEEDADLLKSLGLNIVRLAHYPQSKHFINRCDKIGLLVFEELPGWQHIGNEDWISLSLESIKKMIKRDKNHPSIIIWGVRINESADNHDFYKRANDLARSLDPTRQTGGVRNIANSEFLEDVYTYNDFSHEGYNKGLEKKRKIVKNNPPYLVTEYNGHMFPTKAYDNEIHRLEHAKRHLNVINQMKDKNNQISGSIGWCFSDYQTHQEFGSGDGICHHGVLDIYRNKKPASYAYMAENSKEIVLEVLSDMHIGEYEKGYLKEVYCLTNVDYIDLYKDNTFIKRFYKRFDLYKNLDNPPIIIDDFIGDLIHKNEGFTKKDSEKIKKVLKAAQIYGPKLPLRYKLTTLLLLKKYQLKMDDGVKLFYKYLSGWGDSQSKYEFKGYKDEKLVKTVTRSIYKTYHYELDITRDTLYHADTYDATRVTFKMLNNDNHVVSYNFSPITVTTKGDISLIGPSNITLNSGIVSFWIKTENKGQGTVIVNIDDKTYKKDVMIK